MITLLVNVIGLLLIGGIVWWFWGSESSPAPIQSGSIAEIKVKDGVYQPAHIEAKANQPLTLRFIREDATPCAEVVIFSALNISQVLPMNKPVDIAIQVKNPGVYEFTCQMGMYRGKLIVT